MPSVQPKKPNVGYVNPGYIGNGLCLRDYVQNCFFLPGSALPLGLVIPGEAAPLPQVGGGQVLQAFRRIPLPAPRSQAQPAGKTLVNFDTIFYVDADGFGRTITLLGRRVDLDITPSSYTWTWGDGSSITTDRPGSPYPAKDVVHRYPDAEVTVAHRVAITWSARFRVDGGPWRDVPGTATSTGPATDLRIAEAVPVLSGVR